LGSASRNGSVGGPPPHGESALSWPLPQDDGEDEDSSRPGVDVMPVADDWDRYLLELGAPRREGLRAGARLLSFTGLGLAVAVTGWINVTGFSTPDTPSHPIRETVMWAFALTGTLLVIVSLILLAMAVIEAWPWSRRRRRDA
jgi:hypothetical protein